MGSDVDALPPVLAKLASREAERIAQKYQIEQARALDTLAASWLLNRPLMDVAADAGSEGAVARTRVYKTAVTDITRKIYYGLRQYHGDDVVAEVVAELEELPAGAPDNVVEALARRLAEGHVSTRERIGHLDQLQSRLGSVLRSARTVLDVGSGTLPAVLDLGPATGPLELYMAIERDSLAARAVAALARARHDHRLRVLRWQISDGWDIVRATSNVETFDVALLLKLVPVVERQAPADLEILAKTPAERLVVSGSRTSMTKRRSIERRELNSLRSFAARFKFEVTEEFETDDEVAVVLSR